MPKNITLPVSADTTALERQIQRALNRSAANPIKLGGSAKSIEGILQPLGRITGQADEFTKSMEAANARVLAFGASVGVLAGITNGFKELLSVTVQVEESLTKINSIFTAQPGNREILSDEIFGVAREAAASFDVAADAALELSRQGLNAEQVLTRLKDVLILSRLSGLDAAASVEGLTAAVNSFSSSGITSAEVLNKISAASIKAAVSDKDLIDGLKRSASVAVSTGISFDELVGIISALQQKTARGGAVIGNSLKTIFTRIQSLENLKTIENLGAKVTDVNGEVLSSLEIIENFAKVLKELPEGERITEAEGIVGKFQIAPFLSLLEDINSEQQIYKKLALESGDATDEAYKRNIQQNETLQSKIAQTVLTLKQFANQLGEIGVIDPLKNLISSFEKIIQVFQELTTSGLGNFLGDGLFKDFFNFISNLVFEGEDAGKKIGEGLFKGLGRVIFGPTGIALVGGIILLLTRNLIKFGLDSLKTFFRINQAARNIAETEGIIAQNLLTNKNLQAQILSLEGNRLAQARVFADALQQQLSSVNKIALLSRQIAPIVSGSAQVQSVRKENQALTSAGGFVPSAVTTEQRDIQKGVGGARSSDKPVVIPNFQFGGGRKGTMVANTGEFLVPNFGGGNGTAVFNREMVGKYGLPEGAKKITAAGGFVPNFAHTLGVNKDNISIRSVTSPLDKSGARQRGTGAVKNSIVEAIALAKQKGFSKITADIISEPSRRAFEKYFGTAKRGKNTWDISQFKNAAGGFVPNFVLGEQVGEKGAQGTFFKLKGDIGVKRFLKGVDEGEIRKDFFFSQYFNQNRVLPAVTAPKVFGDLQTSIKRRRVGKQVITDPIAESVLPGGMVEASKLGEVMTGLLYDRGINILDLHGRNYTLPKKYANLISEKDLLSIPFAQQDDVVLGLLGEINKEGGKVNLIDLGLTDFVDKSKNKKFGISARGFIPQFAGGFVPNFARFMGQNILFRSETPFGGGKEKQFSVKEKQFLKSFDSIGATQLLTNLIKQRRFKTLGQNKNRETVDLESNLLSTMGNLGEFWEGYDEIRIDRGELTKNPINFTDTLLEELSHSFDASGAKNIKLPRYITERASSTERLSDSDDFKTITRDTFEGPAFKRSPDRPRILSDILDDINYSYDDRPQTQRIELFGKTLAGILSPRNSLGGRQQLLKTPPGEFISNLISKEYGIRPERLIQLGSTLSGDRAKGLLKRSTKEKFAKGFIPNFRDPLELIAGKDYESNITRSLGLPDPQNNIFDISESALSASSTARSFFPSWMKIGEIKSGFSRASVGSLVGKLINNNADKARSVFSESGIVSINSLIPSGFGLISPTGQSRIDSTVAGLRNSRNSLAGISKTGARFLEGAFYRDGRLDPSAKNKRVSGTFRPVKIQGNEFDNADPFAKGFIPNFALGPAGIVDELLGRKILTLGDQSSLEAFRRPSLGKTGKGGFDFSSILGPEFSNVNSAQIQNVFDRKYSVKLKKQGALEEAKKLSEETGKKVTPKSVRGAKVAFQGVKDVSQRERQVKLGAKNIGIDASKLGGIAGVAANAGAKTFIEESFILGQKKNLAEKLKAIAPEIIPSLAVSEGGSFRDTITLKKIQSAPIPSFRQADEEGQKDLSKRVNDLVSPALIRLASDIVSQSKKASSFNQLTNGAIGKELAKVPGRSKGGLLPSGAEGQILEAAGKLFLNSVNKVAESFDPKDEKRPFDFTNKGLNKDALDVDAQYVDFKRSSSGFKNNSGSLLNKTIQLVAGGKGAVDKKFQPVFVNALKDGLANDSVLIGAAGGFIPNFASPFAAAATVTLGPAPSVSYRGKVTKVNLPENIRKNISKKPSLRQKVKNALAAAAVRGLNLSNNQVVRQVLGFADDIAPLLGIGAEGFVPNFTDPLSAAVNREVKAGVAKNKIFIDRSPRLRSASNPEGLAVANRRDEPAGLFQGINRSIRLGQDPKKAGALAAGGFIPNFIDPAQATLGGLGGLEGLGRSEALDQVEKRLAEAIKELGKEYKDRRLDLRVQNRELEEAEDKLKKEIEKTKNAQQQVRLRNEKIQKSPTASRELKSRSRKLLAKRTDEVSLLQRDLKASRAELKESRAALRGLTDARKEQTAALERAGEELKKDVRTATRGTITSFGRERTITPKAVEDSQKPPRDRLAVLFGLQALAGLLQGAFSDAEQGLGRFANRVTDTGASITSVVFGFSALNQALEGSDSKIAGFLSGVSKAGAGILIAKEVVDLGITLWEDFTGITDILSDSFTGLKDASDKASQALASLPSQQKEAARKQAEDITKTLFGAGGLKGAFKSTGSIKASKSIRESAAKSIEEAILLGVDPEKIKRLVLEAAGPAPSIPQRPSSSQGFGTITPARDFTTPILSAQELAKADSILKSIFSNIAKNAPNLEKINFKEIGFDKFFGQEVSIDKLVASLKLDDENLEGIRSLVNKKPLPVEVVPVISESILRDLIKSPALQSAREQIAEVLGPDIKPDSDQVREELFKGLTNASKELVASRKEEKDASERINREYQESLRLLKAQGSARKAISDLLNKTRREELKLLEDELKIQSSINLTEREKQNQLGIVKIEREAQIKLFKEQATLTEKIKDDIATTAKGIKGFQIEKVEGVLDSLIEGVRSLNDTEIEKIIAGGFVNITEFKDLAASLDELEKIVDRINNSIVEGSGIKKINKQAFLKPTQDFVIESAKITKENDTQIDQDKEKFRIQQRGKVLVEDTTNLYKNRTELLSREISLQRELSKILSDRKTEEETSLEKEIAVLSIEPRFETRTDALKREFLKIEKELALAAGPALNRQIETTTRTALQKARDLISAQAEKEFNEPGTKKINTSDLDKFKRGLEEIKKFEDLIEFDKSSKFRSNTNELKLQKDILDGQIKNLEQINEQNQISLNLQKDITQEQLEEAKQGEFFAGLSKGLIDIRKQSANFEFNLGQDLPKLFSQNMSEAMNKLILQGEDFGEVLRSAAINFLNELNNRAFGQIADLLLGGSQPSNEKPPTLGGGILGGLLGAFTKRNSGGSIKGGSGVRDDVPALLTGGEFVINKQAVSRYGVKFFDMLNSMRVPQFQDGGFFSPGLFGQEEIRGRKDLLQFATQSFTTGANDVVGGDRDTAFINLEPESVRLTNFGRTQGSPLQQALRSDKESAFGLFTQENEQRKQIREQEKAQKKALNAQLLTAGIGLLATPIIKNVFGAFKAGGFEGLGRTFKASSSGGPKGILNFLFGDGSIDTSGAGKAFPVGNGNVLQGLPVESAGLSAPIANIASQGVSPNVVRGNFSRQLGPVIPREPFLDQLQFEGNILGLSDDLFKLLEERRIENQFSIIPYKRIDTSNLEGFNSRNPLVPTRNATGGSIPNALGTDTIPAMLSGGEFVFNRAATQRVGAGNLQALNAGGSNILTEEKSEDLNDKILSKLDELIKATEGEGGAVGSINITVNSDGTSSQQGNIEDQGTQNLGQRIRDAVVRVIEEEKRLGGSLRRGLG